jgi:hypothetical protein
LNNRRGIYGNNNLNVCSLRLKRVFIIEYYTEQYYLQSLFYKKLPLCSLGERRGKVNSGCGYLTKTSICLVHCEILYSMQRRVLQLCRPKSMPYGPWSSSSKWLYGIFKLHVRNQRSLALRNSNGSTYRFDTWLPSIRAKLRVDGPSVSDSIAQFYYMFLNLESYVQAIVLPQLSQAEDSETWDHNFGTTLAR